LSPKVHVGPQTPQTGAVAAATSGVPTAGPVFVQPMASADPTTFTVAHAAGSAAYAILDAQERHDGSNPLAHAGVPRGLPARADPDPSPPDLPAGSLGLETIRLG